MTSNITNWFGRGGNNIIQLINCLYFSFYINSYEKITFPKHSLFKVNEIFNTNSKIKYDNTITNGIFFYAIKMGFEIEPYKMREISQTYLTDIINLNLQIGDNNDLYIHLRLGDTLRDGCIHFPPPIKLYKNIINEDNYDNYIFVYEKDDFLITELKKIKNKKLKFKSSSFESDIESLCKATNLLIAFSTFSLMIYFLSKNIKNLLIPSYILDEWYTNMRFGLNTELYILKNYDINNWRKLKNLEEKKELILRYDSNISKQNVSEINFLFSASASNFATNS